MPNNASVRKRRSGIREQILETALHLYSSRGYFNTSIHDIQKNAGVSMGSVYNYFAGKEAIARALYGDMLKRMETLVDEIMRRYPDSRQRGRAVIKALFELAESDPEMMRFVLNARHQEFLPDEPPICSSRPFAMLRDIVADGMRKGELRPMNPWVAASMTFGPALRMISLRLDGVMEEALDGKVEEVWKLTWEAIDAGELPSIED